MLAPVATKALTVNFPRPFVPPTTRATPGAVASLMSALEACISLYKTIVGGEVGQPIDFKIFSLERILHVEVRQGEALPGGFP